jgi:hypothetical protein
MMDLRVDPEVVSKRKVTSLERFEVFDQCQLVILRQVNPVKVATIRITWKTGVKKEVSVILL